MPEWLLIVIAIVPGLSLLAAVIGIEVAKVRRPKPTPEIVPKPEFRANACEHCGRPLPLDGRGTVPGEW